MLNSYSRWSLARCSCKSNGKVAYLTRFHTLEIPPISPEVTVRFITPNAVVSHLFYRIHPLYRRVRKITPPVAAFDLSCMA